MKRTVSKMNVLLFETTLALAWLTAIPSLAQHSPSTVYQSSIDRIQTFIVGNDGRLYDKFFNGQWLWENQGFPNSSTAATQAINSPGAVYQSQQDREMAFVVGADGNLYDVYYSNGWIWEPQENPGTHVINSPSASYQSSINRVQVFMVGADGQLYDKFYNGQQWVWEPLGLPKSGDHTTEAINSPSAVYQSRQDRQMVFFVGADGHLWDKYYNNGWIWEDQGTPGTPLINSPSAVYQSSINRVQVFVVGNDGRLYDLYYNGQQWVWESQGFPPGAARAINSPGAIYQSQQDRLIAFVLGSDGHLHDVYFNHGWHWEDQGAPTSSCSCRATLLKNSPSPVYQSSINRVQVFVVGSDGLLYDKYYNGQQWVWEPQGDDGVTF